MKLFQRLLFFSLLIPGIFLGVAEAGELKIPSPPQVYVQNEFQGDNREDGHDLKDISSERREIISLDGKESIRGNETNSGKLGDHLEQSDIQKEKPGWLERTFWLTLKAWIKERNRNEPERGIP